MHSLGKFFDARGTSTRCMKQHHTHYVYARRYVWYQVMSTLENDEELQKKGVVQVVNLYGKLEHQSKIVDLLWHAQHILKDWPFRHLGLHICYDQPALRALLDCAHVVSGKDLRVRERCHFGSKMESEYALLSFGIRAADWFSPGQGMLCPQKLDKYVDDRRRREAEWRRQENSDSKFVPYPTKQMVLMGRGRPFHQWLGNEELSKLVSMHTDRYMDRVDRVDKTMIALEIVQRIQIGGGRFIRRTDEGWETVEDQVAKEKVSQALRAEVRERNSSTSPAKVEGYGLTIPFSAPQRTTPTTARHAESNVETDPPDAKRLRIS
jgi:hypothetical protein